MESNMFTRRSVSVGESRSSSLSSALAAMDANRARFRETDDEDARVQDRNPPGVNMESLGDPLGTTIVGASPVGSSVGRSATNPASPNPTTLYSMNPTSPIAMNRSYFMRINDPHDVVPSVPTAANHVAGQNDNSMADLERELEARAELAAAQLYAGFNSPQPEPVLLTPGGSTPPRFNFSRRSTLADRPDLDHLLAAACVTYEGEAYLPLNAHLLKKLSPLWNGAKPIADHTVFKNVVITEGIYAVHTDHVIAALQRIGVSCQRLAILSSAKTSEFGDVFSREVDNIDPVSDWLKVFRSLQGLNTVIVVLGATERKPRLALASLRDALDLAYKGRNRPHLSQIRTSH